MSTEKIEEMLIREGEFVESWLKRLDGGKGWLKQEEQVVAPEIYEKPRALPAKRKIS